MNDEDAVIAANEAFYQALTRGDYRAMQQIWDADAPVACIHPGWDALTDRQSVMQSWKSILENPPAIVCRNPEVLFYGDLAVVVCEEHIYGGILIATNTYVRDDPTWRLVLHQASPIELLPGDELEEDDVDEDDDDDDLEDGGPPPGSSNSVH